MKKLIFSVFAAAVLFSSCNKSETASTTGGPGRLSVRITDDPFNINYVESATVTITKVEIRKAGANEGDPFITLTENPATFDLFQLRNGITQELVNLEVPQGNYDLIRLYVGEAGLKIKDHAESFNLKVPSGQQTGIKVFINPEIHVEGGISAELLLDFDLSKSFVMRGNMSHSAGINGFIFKPCIRATNNSTAGRIEGFVRDISEVIIPDAKVWVIKETVIATTFADTEGHYALIGIPAGTFTVFAWKTGYDTARVAGIEVYPGNKSIEDFALFPSIPVFISSAIENSDPSILEMTYSLTLSDTGTDPSAFTVMVNSVARSVNSVSVSDKKVLLTLASPVVKDDVVTVAYTKPLTDPLQTPQGSQATSFPAQNVTNNVGI